MYRGQAIQLRALDDGIIELCFDREGESVNKLDRRTIAELMEATRHIRENEHARGVVISSGKDAFIAGADIAEFGELFQLPEPELIARNLHSNQALTAIETLPVPVVVAIKGFALGGGLELALAADLRVAASDAQLGLPEVKLGLFPGLGGTVRLPRIAGTRVALEWIMTGATMSAQAALEAGVIDAIFSPEELRSAALAFLQETLAAGSAWKSRRAAKEAAVVTEPSVFDEAQRTFRVPLHQPAAAAAAELLRTSVWVRRDEALMLEAQGFAKIAKTQAADSLVQIFLSDQRVKKLARVQAREGKLVQRAAVVGAGIMGGGIACTCAMRNVPVCMKDIQERQLQLGMSEARKLMAKKLDPHKLDETLALISPQLDDARFGEVDLAVEAVVESLQVKQIVLPQIEQAVREDAVIVSNTSSLRIDDLAGSLARPWNFAGMHFFNPVPVMPLVEIIRGAQTSESTVATVVRFALALGKTPVVVRDGPGFLVNRVLTPYMQAFSRLVLDGANFEQIDRVMEAFGWSMGPAYLNDVVGIDTAAKVAAIIGAGNPQRLARLSPDPLDVLTQAQRFGQKSGLGFYRYETDARGKPKKIPAPETHALLAKVQKHATREFKDAEIIERMMLPMTLEAALCLQENVVASAPELDMAMLLGVGYPQYLGGPLKYADWLGIHRVVERLERHGYSPPPGLKLRERFYLSHPAGIAHAPANVIH